MKLCMIGTGYVGLVSGVCFADLGNDVICVDKDIKKINSLHERFINKKIDLSTEDKVEAIFYDYKSILNEKLGHIQK